MNEAGLHEQRPVEIDPSPYGLPGYNAVTSYLSRHQIYYERRGDVFLVPARHADDVASVMAVLSQRGHAVDPYDVSLDSPIAKWTRQRLRRAESDSGGVEVLRAASFWLRPVRYIVDGFAVVVLQSLLIVILRGAVDLDVAIAVGVTIPIFVVLVAPNAKAGRTPGAVVTGTQVVAFATLYPPGWRRSLVRWSVPAGPGLAAFGLAGLDLGRSTQIWINASAFVASMVVYLWMFLEPDRRGIHDLVSGTIVVQPSSRS